MDYIIYIVAFALVFLNNLIPVFGPPTWSILSFIVLTYPISSLPLLVVVGVLGAAAGRAGLTFYSHHLIRNKILSKHMRDNIDHLKAHLIKNKWVASGLFLLDSLTPLPSDQLFIAYGLTGMPLVYAMVPFILGRLVTYSFWVYTANYVASSISITSWSIFSFFGGSFIIVEIGLFFLVYLFIRIDWEYLIMHKGFRLITSRI